MKKLILLLIPISVFLAIVAIYFDKDLSFSYVVRGLPTIDVKQLDFGVLRSALDKLSVSQYYEEASEWYEYVPATFNLLYNFFISIGTFLGFIEYLIGWVFYNFISLIQYIFTYLFS